MLQEASAAPVSGFGPVQGQPPSAPALTPPPGSYASTAYSAPLMQPGQMSGGRYAGPGRGAAAGAAGGRGRVMGPGYRYQPY
eukprot:scaffold650149_cov41-Prasinocladus_malaysianus.AAC.1